MAFRQIFLGVSGGTVLALLALFLAVPRSLAEREAPPWIPGWAAQWGVTSLEAGAEPKLAAKAPIESEEAIDRQHLVASWGPGGPGAALDEGLPEEELLVGADPTPPRADQLDADLYLGALSKQTIIRSRPEPSAQIVGFARTGALLRRAPISAGTRGCSGGWYRVEPDGYVCLGKAATLDAQHPIIRLASLQPDRSLPMPYPYGESRYPTPPLYTRIPTAEQQTLVEQDLVGHKRKNFGALWEESADIPPPELLKEGRIIPRPYGYPVLEQDFMTGRALGSSAFAFIDLFESEGRRWGLTTDLSLLPLDRLTPITPSEFSGLTLSDDENLPVAFVRSRVQFLYEGSPEHGTLSPTRKLEYREGFHLTGKEIKRYGETYLEIQGGAYIKDHPLLVRVTAPLKMPHWAKDDRSWIEVSILNQTLIAYRGAKPIFATLVSTGKDGLGDPTTTHSTARGVFLIHTKHVTSTMSGDAADDAFDLRDVPYVQFFHEGYAFHAAFWHDGFGQPRSHGCVNLSPRDARHLFSVTEPPVPLRWHSALARDGTLVHIHP